MRGCDPPSSCSRPSDSADTADSADTGGGTPGHDGLAPVGEIALGSAEAFLAAESYDYGGAWVAPAGDVNGDRLADLLVCAPFSTLRGGVGVTYLLHGDPAGSLADAAAFLQSDAAGGGLLAIGLGDQDGDGLDDVLASADGALWLSAGDPAGAVTLSASGASISDPDGYTLGYGLAGADFDGDGTKDVVAGLSYGSASGVAVFQGPLTSHVTTADASARVTGITYGARTDGSGEYYTYTLSAGAWTDAGDLDGDGLAELVVGDSYSSAGAAAGGAFYVFDSATLTGTVDVADADAFGVASTAWTYLGNSVDVVDDLDGDGTADLLVAAPSESAVTPSSGGAAYVFRGPLTGTVDTTDAVASFEASADEGNAPFTASTAGDIDGDGRADVLVGAPMAGGYMYGSGYGWFEDAGAAFLFYGTVSGSYDVTDADAVLRGEGEAEVGYSLAAAGDLDGDGWDDLAVGGLSGAWIEYGGTR